VALAVAWELNSMMIVLVSNQNEFGARISLDYGGLGARNAAIIRGLSVLDAPGRRWSGWLLRKR
jgi:hypothetical protein